MIWGFLPYNLFSCLLCGHAGVDLHVKVIFFRDAHGELAPL